MSLEPSPLEFQQHLWDKPGWDVVTFSGHSSSANGGSIYINSKNSLSVADVKSGFRQAVKNRLSLVFLNSCDGLEFAARLGELNVPQVIAMRDYVPDAIAQNFFEHLFGAIADGKPLHLAMRQAREYLEIFEVLFPCASWLPVACQNLKF